MFDDGVFPTWYVVLESMVEACCLLMSVVSLPLFAFEIRALIGYRRTLFQGIFYRLMIVGCCVDVISLLNLYVGQLIPSKMWFPEFYSQQGNLIGLLFYFFSYGCRVVQGSTATLLAFNRFSAVCQPMTYRKIWSPRFSMIYFFVQLCLAVVVFAMLVPQSFEYVFQDGGYYARFKSEEGKATFFTLAGVFECIFVALIIVFNVTMLFSYRRKFKLSQKVNTAKAQGAEKTRVQVEKQRQEQSMTVMSFITCSVELIYFIFVVYTLNINRNINKRVFYLSYNLVAVIYSIFSPWMLLVFSKPMQRRLHDLCDNSSVVRRASKAVCVRRLISCINGPRNVTTSSTQRISVGAISAISVHSLRV